MKILVFGAGVIGCYLTHVLCSAGHDVNLLARGKWKQTLETHGLELRHHLQHRRTLDHPHIVDSIDPSVRWDAVFAVMPYHQMQKILPQLAAADTDLLILVGNNMRAASMEAELHALSKAPKEILFAFQVTGGQRFADYAVIERFGKAGLDIGRLHDYPSEKAQGKLNTVFKGTGYTLHWQSNMEAWLYCHPAGILPIVYLVYACGGDLRRSTARQRRQMLEASAEAFDALASLRIPVLPKDDDKFFRPGPRRALMRMLYFIMAKSAVGDLIACAHCRNAVTEMEWLDGDFTQLLRKAGNCSMPAWEILKAQMPSWQEVHRLYDRKGDQA